MNWIEFRALKQQNDRPHHGANLLLRHFDITEPPIDVEKIINKLGIKLYRIDKPGWDGACDSTTHTAHIWINTNINLYRQKFAIAHELGHILLHPPGVYRDATFERKNDEEKDANDFANGLLLPLWILEPIVTDRRVSNPYLEKLFQVNAGPLGAQLEKLL